MRSAQSQNQRTASLPVFTGNRVRAAAFPPLCAYSNWGEKSFWITGKLFFFCWNTATGATSNSRCRAGKCQVRQPSSSADVRQIQMYSTSDEALQKWTNVTLIFVHFFIPNWHIWQPQREQFKGKDELRLSILSTNNPIIIEKETPQCWSIFINQENVIFMVNLHLWKNNWKWNSHIKRGEFGSVPPPAWKTKDLTNTQCRPCLIPQ